MSALIRAFRIELNGFFAQLLVVVVPFASVFVGSYLLFGRLRERESEGGRAIDGLADRGTLVKSARTC